MPQLLVHLPCHFIISSSTHTDNIGVKYLLTAVTSTVCHESEEAYDDSLYFLCWEPALRVPSPQRSRTSHSFLLSHPPCCMDTATFSAPQAAPSPRPPCQHAHGQMLFVLSFHRTVPSAVLSGFACVCAWVYGGVWIDLPLLSLSAATVRCPCFSNGLK